VGKDGILVRVLGDYGPFSSMGKSIGYQVSIGDSSFLVDCGSPVFQQIGGHGLKAIKGLIITHCHDDHKRWFTDLSLFNKYAPDIQHKLAVFTSETINEGLIVSSGPALNTSLSGDSKTVVDLAYEDYIDFQLLGPRPKYRIVKKDTGAGSSVFTVVDTLGGTVGPEKAKIIISTINGTARMLFKDAEYDEWVEPEQFYSFSSPNFYEENSNIYEDSNGFTIEAINAPVWHGVPSIGVKFRTATESLIFSGDTAHDIELWQALHSEKRPQHFHGPRRDFDASSILYGDINNFIERIWSHERYHDALATFDDSVVIHDIATRKSVVHTDYRRLKHTMLRKDRTILTHSPDKMTSEWVLSKADKTFLIQGESFYEVVEDVLLPMNAAVYHKQDGKYYVGFENAAGNTIIYENDGLLNLGGKWGWENGNELYSVDLYEDIGGKYFPKLDDGGTSRYVGRSDGKVELVTYNEIGSQGVVVEDQRCQLCKTCEEPSNMPLNVDASRQQNVRNNS
jgi:ribonuclease BN (tRNA processing enzyme)